MVPLCRNDWLISSTCPTKILAREPILDRRETPSAMQSPQLFALNTVVDGVGKNAAPTPLFRDIGVS